MSRKRKSKAKRVLPAVEKSTLKAIAANATFGQGAGMAVMNGPPTTTSRSNTTSFTGSQPNLLSIGEGSVGPPTAELKEKFSAQKIPLQTDFSELIDVADCGRKAAGLSPTQPGGVGAGLLLDAAERLAVLPGDGVNVTSVGVAVSPEADKGLTVSAAGVAVKAGPGINVGAAGVSVDVSAVLPAGMIMMFYGAEIPSGWVICDGNNNTPDLRDRFVLGGVMADKGITNNTKVTGNGPNKTFSAKSNEVAPSITLSIDDTTLSSDQIPVHQHSGGIRLRYPGSTASVAQYGEVGISVSSSASCISVDSCDWRAEGQPVKLANTSQYGGGKGHKHTGKATQAGHAHSVNVVPPYCILVFIMKT